LSESWELSLALRVRAQKDNDPQSAEAQTDQGVLAAVTMKKNRLQRKNYYDIGNCSFGVSFFCCFSNRVAKPVILTASTLNNSQRFG